MNDKVIYLKHSNGATHVISGRGFAKLAKAIKAGKGGAEVATLVENGYVSFLGPDGEQWDIESIHKLFTKGIR